MKMNIRYMAAVLGLTIPLLCSALPAQASLWPGLGTKASEKSGAFRTDDFREHTSELQSPWMIAHVNNETFAGKVNAAIAREKRQFVDSVAAQNARKETLGWMSWHEGLVGNFITNTQGLTSLVLIEQTLSAGDAHGTTFAKGLTFNGAGDLVDLPDLLPNLTVDDVNQYILHTAKKKQIALLPKHTVTALPTNFYVGKNKVIYAIYQQNDLTPAEEGVFSVAIGKV